MKQVVHTFGTGTVEIVEVPRPRPAAGMLVVANELSVISAGTERMLVAFGAAGPFEKVRREPERVRQVLHKVATDGLVPTVEAVRAKLTEPIPLGYSSVGIVLEVGDEVRGFAPGDRVATNGPHAEIVCVSDRYAVRVPDEVASEDAAYTVLASVALQALRDARVPVGGVVAILGSGLIGQLAARLAEASGLRAVSYDTAERAGAISSEDAMRSAVLHLTEGEGADAVLVAAEVGDRARGSDPMTLAQELAKLRGRIVLVGGGDPNLDRRAFYERELEFKVSHSYGGRRNFETVMEFLRSGRVEFASVTSTVVGIEDAPGVYRQLAQGALPPGLVFRYPRAVDALDAVAGRRAAPQGRYPRGHAGPRAAVAVIGAGNYATRVLIPALAASNADLRFVASMGGLSSALAARRFGFQSSTTNLQRIWDADVDTVFITTRHDSHSDLVCAALAAGKNVWVEKPLALDRDELARVEQCWRERPIGVIAMAGFNRRFAPTVGRLLTQMSPAPKTMVYTVNAGPLPRDHWLVDPQVGGGRFLGEAIHFVDLLRCLARSRVRTATARLRDQQNGTFTFEFEDGSVGTVHYFANGTTRLPKERLEVYDDGRVFRIDNFRRLEIFGGRRSLHDRARDLVPAAQDKGHEAAVAAFLHAVQTRGPSPIPFGESLEVSRALLDALEAT